MFTQKSIHKCLQHYSKSPKRGDNLNAHELIDKLSKVLSMTEYYLTIKRNETLNYVTVRMNPENIILHGRSQTQEDTDCRIPVI